MITINADDFGMDAEINRSTLVAFERGWISTATLLANMSGFEEACRLADAHGLRSRIGMHFNLTEGRPLTDAMTRQLRFCDERGQFRQRATRFFSLSREEGAAVCNELKAQLEMCRRHGVNPQHFDSHSHIHTEWAIGDIVLRLAKENGVHKVRQTRNCGAQLNLPNRAYKFAFNQRLKWNRVSASDYFGSSDDVRELLRSGTASGVVEVMVHPMLDARGDLVDWCTQERLEETVNFLIPHGFEPMPSRTTTH